MLRSLRVPAAGSPLGPATWRSRHRLLNTVFGVLVCALVGWSAVSGESGLQLLEFTLPLLVVGGVATRMHLPEAVREAALVAGLVSGAAFTGDLAEGAVAGPTAYVIAIALAALYERRATLAFALVVLLVHELAFGTVVPEAPPIGGLPDAASSVVVLTAYVALALLLAAPWPASARLRGRIAAQRGELERLLTVEEFVVGLDTGGRVTSISEHGLAFLGRSREQVLGADWFELALHPRDREAARGAFAAFIDPAAEPLLPPRFHEYEHAIIAAGGERHVFRWRSTVALDARAAIAGTVTAGVDISAGRRAERQLRRERRDLTHLRAIAQSVARETDSRAAVLEEIRLLVDADNTGLFEPAPGARELVVTATTTPALEGSRVPLDGAPSGSGAAYATGEPLFVADAPGSPLIRQQVLAASGASSVLYQPVFCDGEVAAVLGVGWRDPVQELSPRLRELVALAAEELASGLQRIAATRRLEEAALTDPLTGVPNRRAFEDRFAEALTQAAATHQPLAVATMDLNGFKRVNDTEGHAAGDRILKESAALWLAELRPTDVLARLGGDEFAVLLPNCGSEEADRIAARLRGALRHAGGSGVGVAVWDGRESATALLQRADEALYADKAAAARSRLSDPARLAAVEQTGLFGADTDPELDALTTMITRVLGVKISTVSLFSEDSQFFASECGLGATEHGYRMIGLDYSYCQHPAMTGRELIVEDARNHPLLASNPLAIHGVLVAYAGVPLVVNGQTYGVLCAGDGEPRVWSADDLGLLRGFATHITQLVAARLAA